MGQPSGQSAAVVLPGVDDDHDDDDDDDDDDNDDDDNDDDDNDEDDNDDDDNDADDNDSYNPAAGQTAEGGVLETSSASGDWLQVIQDSWPRGVISSGNQIR